MQNKWATMLNQFQDWSVIWKRPLAYCPHQQNTKWTVLNGVKLWKKEFKKTLPLTKNLWLPRAYQWHITLHMLLSKDICPSRWLWLVRELIQWTLEELSLLISNQDENWMLELSEQWVSAWLLSLAHERPVLICGVWLLWAIAHSVSVEWSVKHWPDTRWVEWFSLSITMESTVEYKSCRVIPKIMVWLIWTQMQSMKNLLRPLEEKDLLSTMFKTLIKFAKRFSLQRKIGSNYTLWMSTSNLIVRRNPKKTHGLQETLHLQNSENL